MAIPYTLGGAFDNSKGMAMVRRSHRGVIGATIASTLVLGVASIGVSTDPANAASGNPGSPGTASAKEEIFWEAFENRTTPYATLDQYTGAVVNGEGLNNTGMKYTADPYWINTANCTGMLFGTDLALSQTPRDTCGNINWFNQVKNLADKMPDTVSQTAVATYTTGSAVPPHDGVQLRTDPSTPVNVTGYNDRFLAVGLDAAVMNCYVDGYSHAHPLLAFTYIDGTGKEQVIADEVDANGQIRDRTVNNGTLPSFLKDPGTTYGSNMAFFNSKTAPTSGDYYSPNTDPFYSHLATTYYSKTDPFLIDPCSEANSTRFKVTGTPTRDIATGTYVSRSAFLNTGDTVSLLVRNRTASGSGNDGAVDNLRVYDVTPQLDVNYGVWNSSDATHEGGNQDDRDNLEYGTPSTITYTITNRDDYGSKYGWQFDNVLPEDLVFSGDAVMVCDDQTQASTNNPTTISVNGNSISVRNGFLPVGTKACKITVPVKPTVDPHKNTLNDTRADHRTYTTEVASFTSVRGLDLPNPTTITWYNRHLDVAKSSDATAKVRVGDTITYTLKVTNDGSMDYTADSPFIVWDDYTAAMDDATFVGVTGTTPAGGTTVALSDGRIKWTGALAVGETATLTYTMKVKDGGDGVGTNVVFAPNGENRTADVPTTPTCDVVDGDDATTGESCARVEFLPRSVTLTKNASVDKANTGDTVTYTVTATNPTKGSYTAEYPLTVTDDMTAVLAHATYNNDAAADVAGGTLTWDAKTSSLVWSGPLDAGQTVTITYTVTYTGKGPEAIVNTASVPPEEATPGTSPSVTEEVQGPTPTPTGTPATSTNVQGQPQSGTPTWDGGSPSTPVKISADNPAKLVDPTTGEVTDATTIPATLNGKQVGTYTIDPTTGTVTFKPNPDFVGTPEPATVEAKNTLGTPARTTYTPTVTPVVPRATPAESTGLQGQPQSGTPTFTGGSPLVPVTISADNPAKLIDPTTGQPTDSTSIPAMKDGKQVGTYTIDPTTGKVTFKPDPDFVGTPDPAGVQAKDANGTPVTTTYTPTVIPVTPKGTGATSEGKQGETQTGTPTFAPGSDLVPITISADNPAKLIDPTTGGPTDATTIPAMKDGKQVGTYTIDPATGVVTFIPNKDFTGLPDPATVEAKDANGTPARATYQPYVTPLVPEATDATSTDIQGATQEGTPTFVDGDGNPLVPSADNPAKLIDPATGQPTDETSIPATKDGVVVGTYTLDPLTGKVTFVPNPDFVGTPDPAKVQLLDQNGTPAVGEYQPTVTPVVPVGTGAYSSGLQGETQTGQVTFTPGDERVPITVSADNPAKLIDPTKGQPTDATTIPAMKDGKQVGTYTIDPATGLVTFTPNKDFTGVPDPATVEAKDANGTPARASYQPVVIPKVGSALGSNSADYQGVDQKGTVSFKDGFGDPIVPSASNPVRFIDPATGQPTDATTIPAMKDGKQVGTYTVDPLTGDLVFSPNADFVGTPDPAGLTLLDASGNSLVAYYQPLVLPRPVTPAEPTTPPTTPAEPTTPAAKPSAPASVNPTSPAKANPVTKAPAHSVTPTVTPKGSLAFTGAELAGAGIGAVVLLALGAGALVIRRRHQG